MAIDTLAFTKPLESAGVRRGEAEAQAEALTRYVLPDIATKADLERLKHDLTIRAVGTVGAFDAALFALLKVVH